jgi:hypothetical protein
MDLRALDKVCFTICIVCIVAGVVLSLTMIWGDGWDDEVVVKAWLTLAVFFCASALTLSISKTLGRRDEE